MNPLSRINKHLCSLRLEMIRNNKRSSEPTNPLEELLWNIFTSTDRAIYFIYEHEKLTEKRKGKGIYYIIGYGALCPSHVVSIDPSHPHRLWLHAWFVVSFIGFINVKRNIFQSRFSFFFLPFILSSLQFYDDFFFSHFACFIFRTNFPTNCFNLRLNCIFLRLSSAASLDALNLKWKESIYLYFPIKRPTHNSINNPAG